MVPLDDLWPDPDRRDDALLRCLLDVYEIEAPVILKPEVLTPMQARVLGALSHGLGDSGAADVIGTTIPSVKEHAKHARRRLKAKNTTHACCEALRRGLIT